MLHYLEQYIASSQHKITINLVGCGGTGSHVLTNLAMMNYSLVQLGRQPLFVRVWDPDIVSEHNVGRQIFSPADIGRNKAEVLVERVNRFFGTHWQSMNEMFELPEDKSRKRFYGANITITCVDTISSRKQVRKLFPKRSNFNFISNRYEFPYYWLDIGNGKSSGQVILGSILPIRQPGNADPQTLPTFLDEFPKVKEDPNQPSCSMAEALGNQDLFINKMLATYATHMLWTLLRDYRIDYRGIFLNLDGMRVSKILL
jgi:PRTRC genetic system ThiF family protein